MFLEKPQAAVPRAAKNTAVWFAPRRPIALHNLPYSGVNVQVARRYLAVGKESNDCVKRNNLRGTKPASLVSLLEIRRNSWENFDRCQPRREVECPVI